MPTHFVLDHNFPWHVTRLAWPANIRVTRLADLDSRLTADYEDWEVLRELARRGDVDGFITNDANMLQLAREMVVLMRSRLTLIVTDRVGHNALRATGLVMVYLQQIATQVTDRSQIYVLRPSPLNQRRSTPGVQIDKLAARRGVHASTLISAERSTIRDL